MKNQTMFSNISLIVEISLILLIFLLMFGVFRIDHVEIESFQSNEELIEFCDTLEISLLLEPNENELHCADITTLKVYELNDRNGRQF